MNKKVSLDKELKKSLLDLGWDDIVEELEKSSDEEIEEEDGEEIEEEEEPVSEKAKGIKKSINTIDSTLVQKVSELTKEITDLKKSFSNFNNEVPEKKSFSNMNFLKKSFEGEVIEDSGNRRVLSCSLQKSLVLEELGDIYDSLEDNSVMKSMIGETILGMNSAGGVPTEKVARFLFEKQNIRLIN